MGAVKKPKQHVICKRCGHLDVSIKPIIIGGQVVREGHTGTSITMRCEDCADSEDGRARMCRNCCPTGHATHAPVALEVVS